MSLSTEDDVDDDDSGGTAITDVHACNHRIRFFLKKRVFRLVLCLCPASYVQNVKVKITVKK